MKEIIVAHVDIQETIKNVQLKEKDKTILISNTFWNVDGKQVYITIHGRSYMINPDKLISAINRVKDY